jgi:hypothetical protein
MRHPAASKTTSTCQIIANHTSHSTGFVQHTQTDRQTDRQTHTHTHTRALLNYLHQSPLSNAQITAHIHHLHHHEPDQAVRCSAAGRWLSASRSLQKHLIQAQRHRLGAHHEGNMRRLCRAAQLAGGWRGITVFTPICCRVVCILLPPAPLLQQAHCTCCTRPGRQHCTCCGYGRVCACMCCCCAGLSCAAVPGSAAQCASQGVVSRA